MVRVPIPPASVAPDITGGSIQHTSDMVSMRTCQSHVRGRDHYRTERQIVFLQVDGVFGENEALGSSMVKVD